MRLESKSIEEGELMNIEGRHVGIVAIGLLGVCITLLIGATWLGETAIALTFTIVAGVVAMLSTLVVTAFILRCLGLTDPKEALGLPSGSIRAIIALSLILIFAIVTVFFFQFMDEPFTTTITNSTTIITNSTLGNTTITNSTTTTSGPGQSMIDFSKQTLTTLGTLVVAIAAFYFGTRAVQVAQGSKETADLSINPEGEREWTIGDNPIEIVIITVPKEAAFAWTIKGDEYSSVSNLSQTKLSYKPTVEKGPVTLTFKLPEFPDIAAKELKVTIAKKPDLSINPSGERQVVKGQDVIVDVTATPEDVAVECKSSNENEKVTEETKNKKYKYTPAIDEGEVTLTFKLTKYPNVEAKELKVKIVKPSLSIDPSQPVEKKKGEDLIVKVSATPEGATVVYEISGDEKDPKSVTEQTSNKEYKYTPSIEEGEATLTFKLQGHSDAEAKLTVKIVKPPKK